MKYEKLKEKMELKNKIMIGVAVLITVCAVVGVIELREEDWLNPADSRQA